MKLKISITLGLLVFSLSMFAQQDWSKLSPKQKIKLAKKEQKAAKKDPEYLIIMDEALILFQNREFEKAKEKYAIAHERRPDNVYPMVMLDDIEIAMTLPVEEQKQEEQVPEEIVIDVDEEIIEKRIEQYQVEEMKEEQIEVIASPIIEPEAIDLPEDPEIAISKAEKPVRQAELVAPVVQAQKEYLNDGVYRESLKEGSATIDQVTIVVKGVSTVYRKVSHSWGAVYYFKNEDPIFDTEWDKLISEIEKD